MKFTVRCIRHWKHRSISSRSWICNITLLCVPTPKAAGFLLFSTRREYISFFARVTGCLGRIF